MEARGLVTREPWIDRRHLVVKASRIALRLLALAQGERDPELEWLTSPLVAIPGPDGDWYEHFACGPDLEHYNRDIEGMVRRWRDAFGPYPPFAWATPSGPL
jgi:hypothetical protein